MGLTFTWIYYLVFIIISIIHFSNSTTTTTPFIINWRDDYAIDNFMSDQWHDIASIENNNVNDDMQITLYILDDHQKRLYKNYNSHNNSNLCQEKLELDKRPTPPTLMPEIEREENQKNIEQQPNLNPNESTQSTQNQETITKTNNQKDQQPTSKKVTCENKKDFVERRQNRNKVKGKSKKEIKKDEAKKKKEEERKKAEIENKKRREEAKQKDQRERLEEIMKFLKPNMMSTRYIYEEIVRIERTHEIRDDLRRMVWFLERSFYKKYPLASNVMKCYHNHIKSVHDALDLWNHETNNLLHWPVRNPDPNIDIDFI